MQPGRVLVTGVSGPIGGLLVRALADDPSIETVIGVDTHPPKASIGRAEFVRADIRNPLIAKVIASSAVDTVVHMNVLVTPMVTGGRAAMKETNVIGTMQLLAACQKAPSLRTLVVKSTTAVYGTSPRDPAMFREDMEPKATPSGGFAKDAVEVEGYVRGFGRRRPDVTLTVLRFTNFIGPHVDSVLSRYFSLPVAPTVLGYDPRLQLCHTSDAVAVLRLAIGGDRPGLFNVGGDGVLLLSQALRRLGRPFLAVPSPTVSLAGGLFRRLGIADFSPDQMRVLSHGRVVDTTKLRTEFPFTPAFSTTAAFEDFAASHPGPLRRTPYADTAHNAINGVLERRRLVRA